MLIQFDTLRAFELFEERQASPSKDNVLWSLLYMFLIDWMLFEEFLDRW